jgi:hypothetical protein
MQREYMKTLWSQGPLKYGFVIAHFIMYLALFTLLTTVLIQWNIELFKMSHLFSKRVDREYQLYMAYDMIVHNLAQTISLVKVTAMPPSTETEYLLSLVDGQRCLLAIDQKKLFSTFFAKNGVSSQRRALIATHIDSIKIEQGDAMFFLDLVTSEQQLHGVVAKRATV